ncbi:MAG: hypothetical protein IJK31_00750 [Ruminococcus sp.]|nr:hypothetical protein [Ruminococcus sp.]
MDALGQLIAIILVLLPVFAFVTGKVILRQKDDVKVLPSEKRSAARIPYILLFLAGAANALVVFSIAAIAIASLYSAISDFSVEYGVLFILVCAVGFLTERVRRKLVKKLFVQQTEHITEKLRSLLPFCFGTIGGLAGLLSLEMFEDAFLDSKGIINSAIDWYGDRLLSNYLLGTLILWLLWIALIVFNSLFTLITTIVLIKNKNRKESDVK